jgi:hypothetical protein
MRQSAAPHEPASALGHLRATWDRHDRATTRQDSLLRRIRADEPRLVDRATRLCDEHDRLLVRVRRILRSPARAGRAGNQLMAEIVAMQAAIREHERRVGDLLYEAYAVDLGSPG